MENNITISHYVRGDSVVIHVQDTKYPIMSQMIPQKSKFLLVFMNRYVLNISLFVGTGVEYFSKRYTLISSTRREGRGRLENYLETSSTTVI